MASRRAAAAVVGVRRLGAAAAVEELAPLYPDAVLTAPETQQAKVGWLVAFMSVVVLLLFFVQNVCVSFTPCMYVFFVKWLLFVTLDGFVKSTLQRERPAVVLL